jgi:hypothetical protein
MPIPCAREPQVLLRVTAVNAFLEMLRKVTLNPMNCL